MLLSLGAPLGWWLIQLFVYPDPLLHAPDWLLYAYMGLGTMLVFGTFGFLLGRLERRLLREVVRDPLTGAYNRAFFDQALERAVENTRRTGAPMALIALDIDHFKRVNDQYGHAAGDDVLREFVLVVGRSLRPRDILVRVGGEEFAVILPACGMDEALEVAERIRANVAINSVRTDAGAIHIRVSAGVAPWPLPDRYGSRDGRALEKAADQALYEAKQGGRNRVVRAV
jgi:diguanylate cyclase (GGDEF)-like protein